MISDDELVGEIRARLHRELADLQPPHDLLDRLRATPAAERRSRRRGVRGVMTTRRMRGPTRLRKTTRPFRPSSVVARSTAALCLLLATLIVFVIGGGAALMLRHQRDQLNMPGVGGEPHRTRLMDPGSFVVVLSRPTGARVLEVRSSVSGRTKMVVPGIGPDFTNNGLALSPDRTAAYVTFIGEHRLQIDRIGLADGRRVLVADGEHPAISPDGRRLAYTDALGASQTIAVLDLNTQSTRKINLARWMAGGTDLLPGSITWFGDGSDIAVLPGRAAVRVDGGALTASTGHRGTCAELPSATCILVVHDGSGRQPMSVTRSAVQFRGTPMALAANADNPGSILIATIEGSTTTIYEVTPTRPTGSVQALHHLRAAIPLTFAADGRHLLFERVNSTGLWVADIGQHGGIHTRELSGTGQAEAAAW
jgi:hypothetical protein